MISSPSRQAAHSSDQGERAKRRDGVGCPTNSPEKGSKKIAEKF
jgi:hypothetical protein